MASPCVQIELPLDVEVGPFGFGLPLPYTARLPEYLWLWFGGRKDTQGVAVKEVLFSNRTRKVLGELAADHDDILTLLGTQSNLARLILVCATRRVEILENHRENWLTIRLDADEWFQVVAPQLGHLEEAVKEVEEISRAAILAAACRYLGLTEEVLGS